MNEVILNFRSPAKVGTAVLWVVLVAAMLTPQVGMTRIKSTNVCSACVVKPGVLHLYSKNPHTWEVVKDGGEARLDFSREEDTFNLEARLLEPDTHYTLIQHEPDYPDGSGYMIASASSDSRGNLCLHGEWERWKGKFWLVLQADIHGMSGDGKLDHLRAWNPKRYLFEGRVL